MRQGKPTGDEKPQQTATRALLRLHCYYVSRCNVYHLSEASDLLTLSSVCFERRNQPSGHRRNPY